MRPLWLADDIGETEGGCGINQGQALALLDAPSSAPRLLLQGVARTLPGGAHAPILGPQNSAAAEDFFPVQPTTVAKYSRQIGPAPVG